MASRSPTSKSLEPDLQPQVRLIQTSRRKIVWIYLGLWEHQVGQVLAPLARRPDHEDLDAIEAATGRGFGLIGRVSNAMLHTGYEGRGLGVAMYIEAAKVLRERFDAPIASALCWGEKISPEAGQVWASKRLRAQATVCGHAAWYTGA